MATAHSRKLLFVLSCLVAGLTHLVACSGCRRGLNRGLGTARRTVDKSKWSAHSATDIVSHTEPILCMSFSSDGRILASADREGGIVFWDVASEKVIGRYSDQATRIAGLSVSSQGDRVLCADLRADGSVQLWCLSIPAGEVQWSRPIPASTITALTTTYAGGRPVALVGGGRSFALDVATGTMSPIPSGETVLAFSRDGHYVVSTPGNGIFKLRRLNWQRKEGLASEDVMTVSAADKEAARADNYVPAAVFSDDRTRVAFMLPSEVVVCDISNATELRRFQIPDWDDSFLAISADGKYVAVTALEAGSVAIYEVGASSGPLMVDIPARLITAIRFSPDRASLYVGAAATMSARAWIYRVDPRTGVKRVFGKHSIETPLAAIRLGRKRDCVIATSTHLFSVGFGSDLVIHAATPVTASAGRCRLFYNSAGRVVAMHSAGEVVVYDTKRWVPIARLGRGGSSQQYMSVASVDWERRFLVCASREGVFVYDLQDRRLSKKMRPPLGAIREIAVSRGCRKVAYLFHGLTVPYDVEVRDVATGQSKRVQLKSVHNVRSIMFDSHDDVFVLRAERDELAVCELTSGLQQFALPSTTFQVAYAGDGDLWFTADGKDVCVYDATAKRARRLVGKSGRIRSISCARPDGRYVTTTDYRGVTKLWSTTGMDNGIEIVLERRPRKERSQPSQKKRGKKK